MTEITFHQARDGADGVVLIADRLVPVTDENRAATGTKLEVVKVGPTTTLLTSVGGPDGGLSTVTIQDPKKVLGEAPDEEAVVRFWKGAKKIVEAAVDLISLAFGGGGGGGGEGGAGGSGGSGTCGDVTVVVVGENNGGVNVNCGGGAGGGGGGGGGSRPNN